MTSQALGASDDTAGASDDTASDYAAVPPPPTMTDADYRAAELGVGLAASVTVPSPDASAASLASAVEIGGRQGPDPTRYGDWEMRGRCIDF